MSKNNQLAFSIEDSNKLEEGKGFDAGFTDALTSQDPYSHLNGKFSKSGPDNRNHPGFFSENKESKNMYQMAESDFQKTVNSFKVCRDDLSSVFAKNIVPNKTLNSPNEDYMMDDDVISLSSEVFNNHPSYRIRGRPA